MRESNIKNIVKAVKLTREALNCREITTTVHVFLKNMDGYKKSFPLEVYINTAATYLKLDGTRVSAKEMQLILDRGKK